MRCGPNPATGPEEGRWSKIKEERRPEQPDPNTPGGKIIEIVSTLEAPSLQLFTHPGQDCVPILNVSQDEVRTCMVFMAHNCL